MIKTENGNTTLNGTSAELLADYSSAGKAIKEAFGERGVPAKRVRELLDECVDDAFKTVDELNEAVEAELFKLIKKLMKGDEDDG